MMLWRPSRLTTTFVGLTLALTPLSAACTSSSSTSGHVEAPAVGQGTGQPTPFLSANLVDVSCGGPTRCAAVGISFDPAPKVAPISVSTNGGLSWSQATSEAPGGTKFLSVSCAANVCMAVGASLLGSLMYAATASSPKWITVKPPTSGNAAQAVGCVAKKTCMGIYADLTHVWATLSTDAGTTWTTLGTLPASTGPVHKLSCATTSDCLAIGTTANGTPLITVTHDGGSTWAAASLPTTPVVVSVLSASCQLTSSCTAVIATNTTGATALLQSTDSGATFVAGATSVGAVSAPLAASCTTTGCVVTGHGADGQGRATQVFTDGSTSNLGLRYAPNALSAVSCATITRCVALSPSSLVVLSTSVPKRGSN